MFVYIYIERDREKQTGGIPTHMSDFENTWLVKYTIVYMIMHSVLKNCAFGMECILKYIP